MSRTLLLLLLAALPLSASPRRSLMPLDPRPAVYVQSTPDVATDGRDFIAVWGDERAKDRPNFSRGYAVYASRLGDDGRALDPFGIQLASQGYDPQIEWNGRTYLVTFNVGIKAYARRISSDARPDLAERLISDKPVEGLASDGATFCALTYNYPDSAIVLLDENANVLRRVPIEGLGGSIVSVSRNYVVFTVSGTSLLATTLARDGSLTQETVATVAAGSIVRAYSNGSRVLVTWTNGRSTGIAVVDDRSALVAPPLRYGGLESSVQAPPSVAWDGGSFLAAWPESYGTLTAVRLSANGRTLGEAPFVLETNAEQFRSATNGFRTVLVSAERVSEAPDPVARVIRSFGSSLPEGHVISFTGTPYSEPQTAALGNLVLAVAREGESYGGIAASLFSPDVPGQSRMLLAPQQWNVTSDGPSVAAGPGMFLVAWREVTDHQTRILAKRVLATGVVDPVPIVVAEEGRAIEHFGETAVGWNGSSFLVVWHSNEGRIVAKAVGRNGVPEQKATVSSENGNLDRRTPAVVWTGTSYLVVWSETRPLIGPVSPQNPQRTVYRAAHVDGDANVLGEPQTLFEATGYCQGLALAASRDHILVVTTTGSYLAGADWPVHTLFLDAAGNPLAAAPARIDTATPTFRRMHPAAAWSGTAFLVFWNERPWLEDWSVIEGRSISFHTPMQNLGLDRAPSFFPAAATFTGGVVLVETAALVEQANVARLYARTFAPVREKMRSSRR